MRGGELLINTVLKAKLIERGIPKLGLIIAVNQKVLKHLILAFQKENLRLLRVVIINDKNIPLTTHGVNPRGTDSVHME
jgi:hypothetical protein